VEKILKIVLYILLIALVLFTAWGVWRAVGWMRPPAPRLTLPADTLVWHALPPIVLPADIATNPAASNAAAEANGFLTNQPWIASSNGRVYAGLYKRDWSIEYKIDTIRHEAGIIVGGDFGLYYRFNPVGKLTVGGQIIWDGEKDVRASATAGWRW
jgi:hypothetical protein